MPTTLTLAVARLTTLCFGLVVAAGLSGCLAGRCCSPYDGCDAFPNECVDFGCGAIDWAAPACAAPACAAPTCAVPSCVAPSCVAPIGPSCVAPSCVAPDCGFPAPITCAAPAMGCDGCCGVAPCRPGLSVPIWLRRIAHFPRFTAGLFRGLFACDTCSSCDCCPPMAGGYAPQFHSVTEAMPPTSHTVHQPAMYQPPMQQSMPAVPAVPAAPYESYDSYRSYETESNISEPVYPNYEMPTTPSTLPPVAPEAETVPTVPIPSVDAADVSGNRVWHSGVQPVSHQQSQRRMPVMQLTPGTRPHAKRSADTTAEFTYETW